MDWMTAVGEAISYECDLMTSKYEGPDEYDKNGEIFKLLNPMVKDALFSLYGIESYKDTR